VPFSSIIEFYKNSQANSSMVSNFVLRCIINLIIFIPVAFCNRIYLKKENMINGIVTIIIFSLICYGFKIKTFDIDSILLSSLGYIIVYALFHQLIKENIIKGGNFMKKVICGFIVCTSMFLGLLNVAFAKSYTTAENFTIKNFGAYTLSTQSKKKAKTCNYGYFKLTKNDSATFNRYCVFVTTADTSDAITTETTLSKRTIDETQIKYKTNYQTMNDKTIKAKVRGASLEPSAGSLIQGQFSPEN